MTGPGPPAPGGSSPNWCLKYFDERVIRLYRARLGPAESRREVAGLVSLLGLPLAEAGFRVTGVDVSAAALGQARREAREAGLFVNWVARDMRSLEDDPELEGEFDAALSLGSSLGVFPSEADDLRVLRGMWRALRPGGRLVLETMHRDSFLTGFRQREEWLLKEGTAHVERHFDPVRGVNHERLVWPDGVAKEHAMRIRTATEWDALLREAGLEAEAWYGGWEGEALHPSSPILVALARPGARRVAAAGVGG